MVALSVLYRACRNTQRDWRAERIDYYADRAAQRLPLFDDGEPCPPDPDDADPVQLLLFADDEAFAALVDSMVNSDCD